MHDDYDDIRSRISEKPSWFDENAVPRYCEFSTSSLANVYWRQAALVEIRCQACHAPFLVAMSFTPLISHDRVSLEQRVREKTLHYGDPPNVWCCDVGPTMNSEPVRVVEFWKREDFESVRIPSLEYDL